MSESTIDLLSIQIPIAKGHKPTAAELTPVVIGAVEKALVTR